MVIKHHSGQIKINGIAVMIMNLLFLTVEMQQYIISICMPYYKSKLEMVSSKEIN